MTQRSFLLIAKDEGLAAHVLPPLQAYAVVRRARSHAEALSMLGSTKHWAGAIIDLDEHHGQGLAAVRELREAHPLLSLLAVTSCVSSQLVNGMHALRAELVLRPVCIENLMSFARRGLVNSSIPDDRVAAFVDTLARSRALTPRESQLVAYALGNETRDQLTRRLGVTHNTLKTQVRALLRKCAAPSLDALATTLLRDALVFELVEAEGRADEEEPEPLTASCSALDESARLTA